MSDSVYRKGRVFVQNVFAGILSETDSGYSFVYDKDYLNGENPLAVSLTLPVQSAEFTSKTLFPFFDGLIPEGWLLNKDVQFCSKVLHELRDLSILSYNERMHSHIFL